MSVNFFFNDTATTEIYTLSLHDALPISALNHLPTVAGQAVEWRVHGRACLRTRVVGDVHLHALRVVRRARSEEHTSELQSRQYLVCRLLLEKKTTRCISRILRKMR